MRTILVFLILAFLGCTSVFAQQMDSIPPELQRQWDRKWTTYTSVDGAFRVRVPGQMQEKADTVSTRIGDLVYHTCFYQDQTQYAENFLYMVSYVDYPPGTVHADSTDLLEEFFQATIDEASFSIDGEVLYQSPIELDGHPGRIWRIDYRNRQGVIKNKAFLRENRFYSVQVLTYKELSLNMSMDRFLDSFQLL